ncbi:MAG TPA: hypothetical protein VMA13_07775 [Candidatus Saccharimonadales bacterium]|nr:hypothetical protein [Candidatus Saccharimonadales bacterium]
MFPTAQTSHDWAVALDAVRLEGKADAVLAANIFHSAPTVGETRKFLTERNISVRL